MAFTHFHVHSQYSILDGAASVPGLVEKAIADGSFERLFERHFKTRLEKLALRQRRIIELKNPYLPGKTPFQREALWYRP